MTIAENHEKPELTVIVVSYNTRDLTLKALETLYATTWQTDIQVIVFDNASQDKSAEAVASAFPQAQLIASKENIGFARANNEVAKLAETEWLLLLNPDTECHEGAVDNLLSFGKAHPEGGIYGGRTVFPDGSLNAASCLNKPTVWSLFCSAFGLTALFPNVTAFSPEIIGGWKRDDVRHVDIIVGCFLLIRKELWDRLGGFNERYFMYSEDCDLGLRAQTLGFSPLFTPKAQIMHLIGASWSARSEKMILLLKARITLIKDHFPPHQKRLGLLLMRLWIVNRYFTCYFAHQLGKIFRSSKSEERFFHWKKIWQTRQSWLKGF